MVVDYKKPRANHETEDESIERITVSTCSIELFKRRKKTITESKIIQQMIEHLFQFCSIDVGWRFFNFVPRAIAKYSRKTKPAMVHKSSPRKSTAIYFDQYFLLVTGIRVNFVQPTGSGVHDKDFWCNWKAKHNARSVHWRLPKKRQKTESTK